MLGLLDCEWPYTQIQSGIRGRNFPDDNFKDIFLTTLKAQGYDVTGNPSRFFDEAEDEMRTVYAIGGEITDVKIDVCKQVNLWGTPRGYKGEAAITMNWSTFNTLDRKHVYKTTTKGYAKTTSPNQEGMELLFENAMEAAIHNLGADTLFRDMVFFGAPPADTPDTYSNPYDAPTPSTYPITGRCLYYRRQQWRTIT